MPRPTIGKLNERPLLPTFLRQWRKHRGYNQERAAEMIGVDRTTLSKLERAIIPYNQPFLEATAEAYGCEPSDLLTVNPLIPREVDVLAEYRSASPERKQVIIEILSVKRTGTVGPRA